MHKIKKLRNVDNFRLSAWDYLRYAICSLLTAPICLLLLLPAATQAQQPGATSTEKYLPLLSDKRVALVINQTSEVAGKSLLDILLGKGVGVKKIFVPEHGFRGTADAGAHIDNTTDSATGLPVISLYGKHKQPTPEDLADVDVVVYDLQDVGARFYTYIATLEYCMAACAQNHKQFIVLDRPNPNGFYVDGPVMEPENKSFVGMQPIPIVYGMTAGEYALMLAGEHWADHSADLDMKVIPCTDYDHTKKYQLQVAPSPNLQAMTAVYAYPSLCLFEGTIVSVGRGTKFPFEQYGCPQFEGKYTYSFIPQSGAGSKNPPYEGKRCYGEMVGYGAADVLNKIDNKLYLGWLTNAYKACPDSAKDKFFTPFFVKLCGTSKLIEQIKSDELESVIRASWKPGLDAFKKTRKKYLLYKDFE